MKKIQAPIGDYWMHDGTMIQSMAGWELRCAHCGGVFGIDAASDLEPICHPTTSLRGHATVGTRCPDCQRGKYLTVRRKTFANGVVVDVDETTDDWFPWPDVVLCITAIGIVLGAIALFVQYWPYA